MSDQGWGIVFVLGIAAVLAVIVVVLVWQIFKTAQSKVQADAIAARDDGFRQLAAESTAAQQKIAEEQQRIADELSQLRSRVTAIETLLSEVGGRPTSPQFRHRIGTRRPHRFATVNR